MASQGRSETAPLGSGDLEEELRSRAHAFDFFQAVRLLHLLASEGGGVGTFSIPSEEPVRFTANPHLGFPAGEIQELSTDPRGQPRMEVNFMGLVGNSGVLPHQYSRLVLSEARNGESALRDFLDIFQHRLVSLFYRAWEKTRFFVPFERGEEDFLSSRLFELVGLGSRNIRDRVGVPAEDLLFYAGLLGPQQRSAVSLQGLLEDYLQVPVEVQQFVGSWFPLDEASQARLDDEPDPSSPRLGLHSVVGDEVWDPQARVRLRIGPLSIERFRDFLPGGGAFRALRALTSFFSNEQIDFEAQLVLLKADVPTLVLGQEDDRGTGLGLSTWLRTREPARDADETTLTL